MEAPGHPARRVDLLSLRNEMNDRSIYPLGKRRTLIVLAGALLGMLLASVNQTLAATAMPTIVEDLGGLGHYSWVFSAYVLGATLAIPLYGKLSDLYGRRPLFLTAIGLFSAGSIVAGFAPSMDVLVAGRAVQGLGAGGLMPLGIAVIGDIMAPRARGKWQAVNGIVFGAAAVGGPTIGGWIADNASWRLAFFVSLPLAALALVVVWFGFGRWGKRGAQIEQRRSVREICDLVAGSGRPHDELPGHRPVASKYRERLVRRQRPVPAETCFKVSRGERPERGIPSGAFARSLVGPRWYVPAFDDLAQESVGDEPLAVRAREVARADGSSAGLLQASQNFQRFRELFGG